MNFIALKLIRLYQLTLSPMLGQNCRFHPTCSAYCSQAYEKYGFFSATRKSLHRIFRCHPFNQGGFDPLD